ncbi:MAG TPA: lycopene cyclase domain-containing protein, partial [Ignavibacteriaceae bacterium]
MSFTYLIILIITLAYPLYRSFDKPLYFIRSWKYLFPAILIVASIYIIWDYIFALNGYWGFNEKYILGPKIFGLPIEEILFFIIIPYSCIFIYEVVKEIIDEQQRHFNKVWIQPALLIFFAIMLAFNTDKAYTAVASLSAIITLTLSWIFQKRTLPRFYLAFLIIQVPFFIVNGVLTGTGLDEPVVWYNNDENLSIRV